MGPKNPGRIRNYKVADSRVPAENLNLVEVASAGIGVHTIEALDGVLRVTLPSLGPPVHTSSPELQGARVQSPLMTFPRRRLDDLAHTYSANVRARLLLGRQLIYKYESYLEFWHPPANMQIAVIRVCNVDNSPPNSLRQQDTKLVEWMEAIKSKLRAPASVASVRIRWAPLVSDCAFKVWC